MNALGLIKERRSIRSFLDKKVEKEKIEKLVEAAIWSPSASNLQPWHIVILQREENIKRAKTFSPGVSGKPAALIIFCIDSKKAYEEGGKDEAEVLCYMDIAIAAQNVCLVAADLGLGSCIIRSFNKRALKEIFDIEHEPELMVAIGYPAEDPKAPKRRAFDEVVVYWDEKDE